MVLAQLRLRGAIAGINAGFCWRLNRLATTSTTRDASGTCTVGCEYSGAIFTAVCCGLVVAPPISSGSVKWRRSISEATNTISSSEGVISPLKPTMSALWSTAACRILS